jgi:aquaporin Z
MMQAGPPAGTGSDAESGEFTARIEVRRLITETVGTFTLTLVACSTEVVPVVLGEPPNPLISALAPGLAVLVLISAFGNVSGAHINPAVMLAFACRRAFP